MRTVSARARWSFWVLTTKATYNVRRSVCSESITSPANFKPSSTLRSCPWLGALRLGPVFWHMLKILSLQLNDSTSNISTVAPLAWWYSLVIGLMSHPGFGQQPEQRRTHVWA